MKTLKKYKPLSPSSLKAGDVVYDIAAFYGGIEPVTMEFISRKDGKITFKPIDNFESVYNLQDDGTICLIDTEDAIWYLLID